MSIKPAPRTVEPLVEAFATVLRRRRLAQDLSQEALARRADVSMRFVSLLELVLWNFWLLRQKGAAARHRKLRGSGGGGVVRSLVLQDRGRV